MGGGHERADVLPAARRSTDAAAGFQRRCANAALLRKPVRYAALGVASLLGAVSGNPLGHDTTSLPIGMPTSGLQRFRSVSAWTDAGLGKLLPVPNVDLER